MKKPNDEIQEFEFMLGNNLRRLLCKESNRNITCLDDAGLYPNEGKCKAALQEQTCRFCLDPESILTKETCCTGCSILRKRSSQFQDVSD